MHAILLTTDQLSSVAAAIRIGADKCAANVHELVEEYDGKTKLANETARLFIEQEKDWRALAQSIEDTPALDDGDTRRNVLDALVKSGLESREAIERFAADNSEADRELIEACPADNDGGTECDGPNGSLVSRGADNGAYVLCWVWTYFDEKMKHAENRPPVDEDAEA